MEQAATAYLNGQPQTAYKVIGHMTREDVPALYAMYLEYPLMINCDKIYGIDWLYKVCDDANQFRFSLRMPTKQLCGAATLWWANRSAGILAPTIWIDAQFNGKGYARAALEELWDFALAHIHGMNKMQASVYGYNQRSLRLFESFFGPAEATLEQQCFYEGTYWPLHYFAKLRYVEGGCEDVRSGTHLWRNTGRAPDEAF
jgi:hypothetical protein